MPTRSPIAVASVDDRRCPDDRNLRLFAAGELPGVDTEALIGHIDRCTDCQRRIEVIGDPPPADATESSLQRRLASLRHHQPDDATETILRLLAPHSDRSAEKRSGPTPMPERIGNYHITARLAGGGMGTVYRGRHLHLARDVAIKVLGETIVDRQHASQVLNEWRTHGRLSHPNIVAATDAGLFAGLPYLVTELIDGDDLASIVRHHGPLSPVQAAAVLEQVANGLDYAHREGIAHLDIKPSNIMIDRDGRVYVLDLGTASAANRSITAHQSDPGEKRQLFGTLAYLAPERMELARSDDPKPPRLTQCDFYSLGCTFHFLLTGRPPFGTLEEQDDRTSKSLELIRAHRGSPSPRLIESAAVSMDSPQWQACQKLIDDLMEKHPDKRPSQMREVATSFCDIASGAESAERTRQSLAETCISSPPPRSTASSGQTIQITDLVATPDTTRGRKQTSRWVTGSIGAVLLGILAFAAFDRTRDASSDARDPSSGDVSGSVGPPGWHLDPRTQSGYAFRSTPLLQRVRAIDPSIRSVAIKTQTPRTLIREMAWSSAGDRLAILTTINQLRLYRWDGRQLTLTHVWRQNAHPIEHICWDWGLDRLWVTSDHLVASLGLRDDGHIDWTALTANAPLIQSIECLENDSHRLLIVTTVQGLIGWDADRDRRVALPFAESMTELSVSPDRRHLALTDGGVVEIWLAEPAAGGWQFSNSFRQSVATRSTIQSLRWSTEGRFLAAAHRHGVSVLDRTARRVVGHLKVPISGSLDHDLVCLSPGEGDSGSGILFRHHDHSVIAEPFQWSSSPSDWKVGARTELIGVGGAFQRARLAVHPKAKLLAVASPGALEVVDHQLRPVAHVSGAEPFSKQHPMQLRAASVLFRPDGSGAVVDHRGRFLGEPIPPLQAGNQSGREVRFHSIVEPELDLYQSRSANDRAVRRNVSRFGIPRASGDRHTFSFVPASSLDPKTATLWSADGKAEDWGFGRLYRPETQRRLRESATEIRRVPVPDLRLVTLTEQPQRLAIVNPEGRYIAFRRNQSRSGSIPRTGNLPAVALDASGSRLIGASYASIGAYIWCKDLSSGSEAWRIYEPQFNSACGVAVLDENRFVVSNWKQWQIRRTDDGGLIDVIDPREAYGFHHSSILQNRIDGSLLSGLPRGLIEPAALWTDELELQWMAFSSGPEDWLLLSRDGEILDRIRPTAQHPYRFRIDPNEEITPLLREPSGEQLPLCLATHHEDGRIGVLPLPTD